MWQKNVVQYSKRSPLYIAKRDICQNQEQQRRSHLSNWAHIYSRAHPHFRRRWIKWCLWNLFFFIRIRSHAALKVSVGMRNIFFFLIEVNICYDQCPSSACAIGMELILTKITPPS